MTDQTFARTARQMHDDCIRRQQQNKCRACPMRDVLSQHKCGLGYPAGWVLPGVRERVAMGDAEFTRKGEG